MEVKKIHFNIADISAIFTVLETVLRVYHWKSNGITGKFAFFAMFFCTVFSNCKNSLTQASIDAVFRAMDMSKIGQKVVV